MTSDTRVACIGKLLSLKPSFISRGQDGCCTWVSPDSQSFNGLIFILKKQSMRKDGIFSFINKQWKLLRASAASSLRDRKCVCGGGEGVCGVPADHPCLWTRNSWSRMGSRKETKRRAHGPHMEQPEGTQGRVGPATQTGERRTRGWG